MIAVIARRNEKSGYNEINRIRAEKKYYAKHNELREDLRSFLDKALAPLAYGGERAVTVAIDSAFLPVLTKVLNLPVYAKNYTCVALKHPRIERNIKHMLEFLFLAKRGA
jgi:hypothetical protein